MSALSIVITVVVIVLICVVLYYIFTDPYTLLSMQNGETSSRIKASSLATNGSNVASGNFAYSIWFYINDWNYRYGEKKVVFGRMSAPSSSSTSSIPGVGGVDPCPAVVLGEFENTVEVSLACYPGVNQEPISTSSGSSPSHTVIKTCNIDNVPVQKWVNLILSVNGRTMDLYIDGKLVRTCMLPGVASVNNSSDVYVTPAGGFEGWTSKFQYYPTPLNPQQAWNIYTRGYSNWLSIFSTYQFKLSLVENGNTQSSVSI